MQSSRKASVLNPVVTAVLAIMLGLTVASTSYGLKLEVLDDEGTPAKFSAHSAQQLCFIVVTNSMVEKPVVSVTFEGPKGDLGTKTAIAGSNVPVCFSAPAVDDAGRWRGCTAPRDSIPEAYLVSAKFDAVGATAEETAKYQDLEPHNFVWRVERQVTDKDPEPEACKSIDGDWTWTFAAGRLVCKKLPMQVTLPSFAESVTIDTDGEGLNALRMTVTGGSTRDRLVLTRQGDASRKGQNVAVWQGVQDISKLIDQGGLIRGRYTIYVLSEERLEGLLEVKDAQVSGDSCSITWPFDVRR